MIPLKDDNPTTRTPYFTFAILAICIIVWLLQVMSGPAMQKVIYTFGFVPAFLFTDVTLAGGVVDFPPSLTIISSMFMHGGWMHIIGNMMYLWIFADNIEDELGHGRFVIFYLICGVVAALAQAVPDIYSTIPMVGASGAISGVLGAYLVQHPKARVLVLIPLGFLTQLIRVPAALVLGLWFLLQLVQSAMAPSGEGGVAFGAHIGGFVAGVVLVKFFVPNKKANRRPY